MAPPFTPELWNLVLEYLPIEKVVECKTVSSELGVAARFALTKGRWKPVAESARQFKTWGSQLVDTKDPCYLAAWALDPKLLAAESALVSPVYAGFLIDTIVERSIDGLGRVVESLEQFTRPDSSEFVTNIFLRWVESVSPSGRYCQSTVWTRLWRELERWSDGTRAGHLLTSQTFLDWFEGEFGQEYALEMTDDWIDQNKRQALMSHIAETEAQFAVWELARAEVDDY